MARDAGRRKAGRERFDAAQSITDEIVALLEAGTLPWRRPWRIAGGGVPLRVGGEPYRGINAFLLGLRAAMAGYSSPTWMTFNQARQLGACVRKGERSSVVVYYGTAGRKDAADGGSAGGDGGGDGAGGRDGGAPEAEAGGAYRFLKSYRVFNAAQIEGLDAAFHPEPETPPEAGPEPIPELEAFFAAVGAEVVTGGDRACYVPALDRVHMPEMARFESASAAYATLAHEMAHWTKAPHRLDRSFGASSFGNEAYAKEELCAELTSVLLGQRLGFTPDHIDNHAAYVGSWLKVLRGDKRFVFRAGADAQRAADFLVDAAAKGATAPGEATTPQKPAAAPAPAETVAA